MLVELYPIWHNALDTELNKVIILQSNHFIMKQKVYKLDTGIQLIDLLLHNKMITMQNNKYFNSVG